MNLFFLNDCKILWEKETHANAHRAPKRDKVAIKADLKTMSNIIEEVMTFTKDKMSEENRETAVQLWLHTGDLEESYYLQIHYDLGMKGWFFGIFTGNNEPTAEIINEKCPCLQIMSDEDADEENL